MSLPLHVIAQLEQIEALIDEIQSTPREGMRRLELATILNRMILGGLRSADRWHYKEVVAFCYEDFLKNEGFTVDNYIRFWEELSEIQRQKS